MSCNNEFAQAGNKTCHQARSDPQKCNIVLTHKYLKSILILSHGTFSFSWKMFVSGHWHNFLKIGFSFIFRCIIFVSEAKWGVKAGSAQVTRSGLLI